jgi:argininosuccinate lyase
VVGRLVRSCIAQGKTFADLTDAEWSEIHPIFGVQKPPLTALESVNARDVPGGTAVARVRSAHADASHAIVELHSWHRDRQTEREGVMRRGSSGTRG